MQADELKQILDVAAYLAEQAAFSARRKRRRAAGRMLGGVVLTLSMAGHRQDVIAAARKGIRERPLRLLLNVPGMKVRPSPVDLGFDEVSPQTLNIPGVDLDDEIA